MLLNSVPTFTFLTQQPHIFLSFLLELLVPCWWTNETKLAWLFSKILTQNQPYILHTSIHIYPFYFYFNPIQRCFCNCSSSSSICVITTVYQTTEKERNAIIIPLPYHLTTISKEYNRKHHTHTRLLSPIKWYVYIIDAVAADMHVCMFNMPVYPTYSRPAAGFGSCMHFISFHDATNYSSSWN